MREADLLLHLVDSSNPDYFQHEQTVNQLLGELEIESIPQITVYNKRDMQHHDFVPTSKTKVIQISALNEFDRPALKELIEENILESMTFFNVEIPSTEGKLLSQLKKETILRTLSFHEEKQLYECSGYFLADHQIAGQLNKYTVR